MDSAASNSASVNPATTYGISLSSLFAFGGVGWAVPSKMAGSNHLYNWEYYPYYIDYYYIRLYYYENYLYYIDYYIHNLE